MTAKRALMIGIWFGLLTGLAEAALLALRRIALGRLVGAGVDVVWMAPLVVAIGFGLVSWVAAVLGRIVRRPLADHYLAAVLTAVGVASLLFQYDRLARTAAVVLALGIGLIVARGWRRFPAVAALPQRTVVLLAGFVALLPAGLAARRWYEDRPAAAAAPGSPNVILLILDTVRAIDLSTYGYDRATAPALDRFARRGIRFAHAMAAAPWTLPSHASMFTGRWPNELTADWTRALDEADPVLAERMAAAGYRTAGFVANTRYCSRETGLARGFQHYEDYPVTAAQTLLAPMLSRMWLRRPRQQRWLRLSADDMNARLLRWLDQEPRDHPFFAFVNYMDAHDPYDPPAPFAGRYSGFVRMQWEQSESNAMDWSDSLVRVARDAYDESIAYLDSRIGVLLGELERRGRLENTVVVVTADHGEEFGEHHAFYHGNSLYRPSLEVPLLVVWPGHLPEGRVVESAVTLRDLPRTILDLAGVRGDLAGSSLARFWADGAPPGTDTLLASVRTHRGLPPRTPISRGNMYSAIIGDIRLIKNGDGRVEAYDFRSDPEERNDLMKSAATREGPAKLAAAMWPDFVSPVP